MPLAERFDGKVRFKSFYYGLHNVYAPRLPFGYASDFFYEEPNFLIKLGDQFNQFFVNGPLSIRYSVDVYDVFDID